jgi:valyl-tRNA synthetase
MAEPKLKERRWDAAFEEEMLRAWQKDWPTFDPDTDKPVYVIDTPPPYPSGTWHIGAAAAYTFIDMAARYQRMRGKAVLFPFGLDRNGINMERVVEGKYGKPMRAFDREEFIRLCREEIEPFSRDLLALAKRLGLSADFDAFGYTTDSPEYRRISQAIFLDLFRRGLVYEGDRPSFYCSECGTTIAEADIQYEERPTTLAWIPFPLPEGGAVPIATTRPELLCACRAVIVHPTDERYLGLHGKMAKVPLYGQEVPVVAHPAAKPEFGTGAAMICSYGDTTDIALFRELRLEPVKAIDEEGRMTEAAGPYAGLPVAEARDRILRDLRSQDLVEKTETSLHRSPLCERSKTPIEFVPMRDWYLRQLDVLDDLRRLADEMEFHPPRSRQFLDDWMASLTIDWPISRRRYYHTEIPLWYCEACGEVLAPEPGPYYRPWKDPAPFDACPKCGGTSFRGEDRVFDTWMDSSNSNLVATLYMRDDAFFRARFPPDLRPQGYEIVRNWLYYTLLKSHYVVGKKPFRHVMIHGLGLDAQGRAMHKSLGNVIDPRDVLAKYGAEALRFWAASEANIGENFRIGYDKIAAARNYLTKLWNVARFISTFERPETGPELTDTDRWILAELNRLVEDALEGYEDYNFFPVANGARDFLWNLFAAHYVEMVKGRAYEGDAAARWTLHEVLGTFLRLTAPITPFITDKIWSEMFGGTVHREAFPTVRREWDSELIATTATLVAFNSRIWKEKKDRGMSLAEPLTGVDLPEDLEPFRADLVRMHRLA